jgi:hypothetical protein
MEADRCGRSSSRNGSSSHVFHIADADWANRKEKAIGGPQTAMMLQNHSPGIFWSRINTDNDSSRPTPLNNAIVTNDSMLAIDVVEARGSSHAIAAFMSISKSWKIGPKFVREINDRFNQRRKFICLLNRLAHFPLPDPAWR